MAERKKASVGRGARAKVKSFIKSFTSLNPQGEQARIDRKLRELALRKGGPVAIKATEGDEVRITRAVPRAFGPPKIIRETKKKGKKG